MIPAAAIDAGGYCFRAGGEVVMAENDKKGLHETIETLTTAPPGSTLSKWQKLVRVIAISIPVIGAIPTAWTIYQSFAHDIPYDEVAYREAQHKLWVKNIDCLPEFQALNTGKGTRIDVGSCPKTGDIAIRIALQDGAATQEWISFEDLKKKTQTASLMDFIIAPALAARSSGTDKPVIRRRGQQLALEGIKVMCQSMSDKKMIVRIVNDGGKCYREVLSPYRGKVESREEVPCDTQCQPTG